MAHETRYGQRTIDAAVRDGLLVDVSETAKRAGMRYQTFMSPSLVARYNARGRNELYQILEMFDNFFAFLTGYDCYGPMNYGSETCILEPNDKYGHVIFILETNRMDELNLKRVTGEEPEYVM